MKHHRANGGFRNLDPGFSPKTLADVVRWRWESWRSGLRKADHADVVAGFCSAITWGARGGRRTTAGNGRSPSFMTDTPAVKPTLAFLHANAKAGAAMIPCVTWIGHSSTLVQLGGMTVLLDPVLSPRVGPGGRIGVKRLVAPALHLHQLPPIDVVVVSHDHYDHLDKRTLRGLARQAGGPPTAVAPLGLRRHLAPQGLPVVELDWWQSTTFAGLEVMLTPAQHWSGRSLHDRLRTLWAGVALLSPGGNVFYPGDTAYASFFREIGTRLAARGGVDLALLPIGAYAPRWFMAPQHIDPAEAVRIHQDLHAKRSLGIHWGTFQLSDEPPDEPPRLLREAAAAAGLAPETFITIAVGETLRL